MEDSNIIEISLPFEIPFLKSTSDDFTTTIRIDKTHLHTLLRVTVIICTYMLFRPYLEKAFRSMLGREDPAAIQEEVDARKKVLEDARAGTQAASPGKRSVAMMGATAGPGEGGFFQAGTRSTTPQQGKAKRRKV